MINVQGLFIYLFIIIVHVCAHTCHYAHHMEEDKVCGGSSLLLPLFPRVLRIELRSTGFGGNGFIHRDTSLSQIQGLNVTEVGSEQK